MKYFPILLAKQGEMVALQHLTQEVKIETSPILRVLRSTLVKQIKKDKQLAGEIEAKVFIKSLITHWSFNGNQILLDFSLLENMSNEHQLIDKLIRTLIQANVNIVPVVHTVSKNQLTSLIKKLYAERLIKKICFKFSDNSEQFSNINSEISDLIKEYTINESCVIILMDLGQVSRDDYNAKAEYGSLALKTLTVPISKWADVVVASSSFPSDLGGFKETDELHSIQRYENNIWHSLISKSFLSEIKYGDYGIKSAIYSDSPHPGTVSLKYSTPTMYYIYKGVRAQDHFLGNGQYIKHAQKLIADHRYAGNDFCWGDEKLYDISEMTAEDDNKGSGNSTKWIQYCQNHHMTLMHTMLSTSN